MNLTIEISWWIVPAIATIAAFVWAMLKVNDHCPAGNFDPAGAVIALLYYGLAIIVSLIAWLIWALIA